MTAPRFFDAAEIGALLGIDAAIESQRRAFRALGEKTAVLPPKTHVPGPGGALALAYPCRLSPDTGPVCKFLSFNPGNAEHGLPSIHGVITVLDPETGVPVAVLDGAAVTTIRTSAASAVAADLLANPDVTELAVLGTGVQGVAHVRAIAAVRPLRTVRMYSPGEEHRTRAARELSAELGLPVVAAEDAESAVRGAGIVALCTVSTEPVIRREWLAEGCTVLSIGSFEPHRREVGRDVVEAAAAVVVDHRETARSHAGPIVDAPLAEPELQELGEVLVGTAPGRRSPADLVYYNSTGVGVQDAAAAWAVLDRDRG
ncbi:ornithine cyclodeaminase family protein [Amycolatopsis albispora]|uniref:Ornithine cyclodeaminase n=1 Tax=Amycolatopsis albispora TaxID=1804986 RepID=A0A344LA82_9PSEU|nr:ornithine cyclodeaminase family protein [Amycolatopsis albispora]AXB44956.1 ornithine cyclodeaminase [Amycolatopsis albispora]